MTARGKGSSDTVVRGRTNSLDDGDDDVIVVGETQSASESAKQQRIKDRKESFLEEGLEDFIPLDFTGDGNPNKKHKYRDGNSNSNYTNNKRGRVRKEDVNVVDLEIDSLCPWLKGHSVSPIPIIALHEEIKLFTKYMEPTPEEVVLRKQVVDSITKVIHGLWPKCEVCVFGSYKTDLYLPTSDIDMVVHGNWTALPLNTLAHALERADIPDKMEVIAKARVPIVKFRDKKSQIHVDISFNQPSGPADAKLILKWKREFVHAKPLVLIIKQFLLQRDLNEPFHGGIGSYAIFLLVLSFLQRRPLRVDDKKVNLGVLLIEFFELYGLNFNFSRVGIRVNGHGSYFDKVKKGWVNRRTTEMMSIENPTNSDHDVTGNAFATAAIREVFAHAYSVLSSCMYERRPSDYSPPDSLLGEIVNVNEETQEYRQWVKETVFLK
eukprot:m.73549 g.73549  ORF g.73549 m.73549 type:complete len:436 (+) comp11774_c0_seq5:67-1374(+)